MEKAYYYSHESVTYTTISTIVIVFFLSVFVSALIERTFINLETTYIFPRKQSSKKKLDNVNAESEAEKINVKNPNISN